MDLKPATASFLSLAASGAIAFFSLPSSSAAAGDQRYYRFRWNPVQAAAVYEIQMAEQADFSEASVNLESKQAEKTVRLGPGKYFWRVRARSTSGKTGVWSTVRKIEFKGPPQPTPTTETPQAKPPIAKTPESGSPPVKKVAAVQKTPAPAPKKETTKAVKIEADPTPAQKTTGRIRQRVNKQTGWESFSLPKGKLLKVIFETADQGAGSDKVLIKVNDRDFQTYPDDRLLLEHDGKYHITSYAIDRVGNKSALRRRKILIDSSAPAIQSQIKDGSLVIEAEDAGVGLELLQWRTGPGDAWRDYVQPVPRQAAGAAGKIEIRARDFLENTATRQAVFTP